MMPEVVIAAFYKFISLPDYKTMRDPLLDICSANDILGSILLAEEGLNGTIAGPREGIDAVLAYLRSDPRLSDMDHKESFASYRPFDRMKVRLKKEIVTIKIPEANPNQQVGTYVDPGEWNTLISQDDVILIDTRNDYELEYGTFKGAINPQIDSFGEFPTFVDSQLNPNEHTKVAMFCTGGIRCEKATSYLLAQGFKEVYHLKGGILKYLEQVPKEQSLWEGECFVFDQRVTVNHDLAPRVTNPEDAITASDERDQES